MKNNHPAIFVSLISSSDDNSTQMLYLVILNYGWAVMSGLRFRVIQAYWVLYWIRLDWIGVGSWRRYVLYWVQLNDCFGITFKKQNHEWPNSENLVSNKIPDMTSFIFFLGSTISPDNPIPERSRWKGEPWHILTSWATAWFIWQQMMVTVLYLTPASTTHTHTHTHTFTHMDGWRGECQSVSGQHGASDMPHCLRPQSCISYQGQMWGCHSQ